MAVELVDPSAILHPKPGETLQQMIDRGIKVVPNPVGPNGPFYLTVKGAGGQKINLPLKDLNELGKTCKVVWAFTPNIYVSSDLSTAVLSCDVETVRSKQPKDIGMEFYLYRCGQNNVIRLAPPHFLDGKPSSDDNDTPCALSLSPHGQSCAILYAVSGKEYLYRYSLDSQTGSVIWTSHWPKGRKMAEYAFLWHGDQLYFTPFDGGPLLKLEAGGRVSKALPLAPLRMFPDEGICFVSAGKAFDVKALSLGKDGTVKTGRTYCVTRSFDRTVPEFAIEKAGPARIMISDAVNGQMVTLRDGSVKIGGAPNTGWLTANGTAVDTYNGQANDTILVLNPDGTPFHVGDKGIELGPTQKDGVTLLQVISGVPVSFYMGYGGPDGRPEDAYLRPARADSNARSRCPLSDENAPDYRMP